MQQLRIIKILLFLFIGIAIYANPATRCDTVMKKEFNILDYGAKSSHTELSTKAIQAAIDACSKNGSGTVIIPKGTYVTGTLFLKSNVTIKMNANTELFGSSSLEDYAEIPVGMEEPHFSKSLFYANGEENIKIIGHPRSEINGKGYMFKHSPERPKLFRIESSKNIEFDNTIIKNSGSWWLSFNRNRWYTLSGICTQGALSLSVLVV
ncbi:hypothetical protein FF125_18660 [Aureibaculum algae]|uniref:Rhamnogalacturonase A/B/Epimerase-like pectate lyase domain-containing protein n=1 Tax=Aureibaculum algae TaxID=2584122 RepID=A0A5B7TVM4_9FLAO|nr:glycosyl hydrolase family 28-related protein [Aureibaculum algae]QCX40370.1 hypothetical protein FF125_18660 [Aureibaculum algae]